MRVRLAGCRHEVEPFEEAQPDAFCGRCCGWGHIAPHCPAAASRCSLRKEGRQTSDHQCPVERCRAKRGHLCAHVVARCRNCFGPHLSQVNVCPAKKKARQLAKGWRLKLWYERKWG